MTDLSPQALPMRIASVLQHKLSRLTKILARMGSAVIGFSGGVDSALVCRVARDALGKKARAITVVSDFLPRREKRGAQRLAEKSRLLHECVGVRMPPRLLENPADRCYHCKRFIFSRLKKIAKDKGIRWVIDGSNTDDMRESRPGRKALKELGVRSPLQEAGLSKQDVRTLARAMGIEVWNKPPYTCLATRIPVGQKITPEKLAAVEKAEQVLQKLGFAFARVRHHDGIARIEVPPQDISRLLRRAPLIAARFKKLGFTYVAADIEGYSRKRTWIKKK